MQATTRTQSGADVAPQVNVPGVTVTTSDGKTEILHIPTTQAEMRQLLARRREISLQLNSVTARRDGLIQQIQTSPQAGVEGLKAQLAFLDARVLQLETDLGNVGKQVAAASPQLIAMAQESITAPPEDLFGAGVGAGAGTVFVLMSAFFFFWRRRWKKARKSAPALPAGDTDRLQRLEHGMEAIAIEVERISEGQRFVTKLLSETRTPESASR
ncbi:MAG TPA: hypothetical protein VJ852_00655 [Gemmatimonadaceae bacterium]|nr:hypothetical protein [Gemmatimonadaceae bacterium]